MEYPATIDVTTPDEMEWWRPLGQWLLALPHLIIVSALEGVGWAVALVAWLVILFTGRLPEGLAKLEVMVIRYTMRVNLYTGFLYTEYPPFEYAMVYEDPGGSPATLTIQPELENRDRLRVGLRFIWIIPALLYVIVIGIVAVLAWIAAFFAVIFTGRWPDGLRAWVMKGVRVSLRLQVYGSMLTDRYPPFSTD